MRYLALLIVIVGTGVIQWHSIDFWMQYAGKSGVAWSIALEAASLWLWWQRKMIVRCVGFMGTVVLLAGPLYVLSSPALSHYSSHVTQTQELANLERLLKIQEDKLALSLENSKKFRGWLPSINDAEQKISEIHTKISQIYAKQDMGNAVPIQTVAIVIIEVLALLIVTVAQITALRFIAEYATSAPAKHREPTKRNTPPKQKEREKDKETKRRNPPKKTTPRLVVSNDADHDTLIAFLKNIVEQENGIKYAAEKLGIDRREIGYALNPNSKRKPKKEIWAILKERMSEEKAVYGATQKEIRIHP